MTRPPVQMKPGDPVRVHTMGDWPAVYLGPHDVPGKIRIGAATGPGWFIATRDDIVPAVAPRHRSDDQHTSITAAMSQTPERLSDGQRVALAALYEAGRSGLTDFQLAERTNTAQTSIGCRRKDLVRLGLAVDTGRKLPAPSGSPSMVWEITDEGLRLHRARQEQRTA